jgi:hypothetical protein
MDSRCPVCTSLRRYSRILVRDDKLRNLEICRMLSLTRPMPLTNLKHMQFGRDVVFLDGHESLVLGALAVDMHRFT